MKKLPYLMLCATLSAGCISKDLIKEFNSFQPRQEFYKPYDGFLWDKDPIPLEQIGKYQNIEELIDDYEDGLLKQIPEDKLCDQIQILLPRNYFNLSIMQKLNDKQYKLHRVVGKVNSLNFCNKMGIEQTIKAYELINNIPKEDKIEFLDELNPQIVTGSYEKDQKIKNLIAKEKSNGYKDILFIVHDKTEEIAQKVKNKYRIQMYIKGIEIIE